MGQGMSPSQIIHNSLSFPHGLKEWSQEESNLFSSYLAGTGVSPVSITVLGAKVLSNHGPVDGFTVCLFNPEENAENSNQVLYTLTQIDILRGGKAKMTILEHFDTKISDQEFSKFSFREPGYG